MRYKGTVYLVLIIFTVIMMAPVNVHTTTVNQYENTPATVVGSQHTYVLLVHGYSPGDLSGTPNTGSWTSGVDFEQQLIDRGYTVGVVSYYGTFTVSFSNGYTYTNSSFFGTANTPIQNIGEQFGIAMEKIFSSGVSNVDIVTHSMGGLVVLYALEHYRNSHMNIDNVIFIAPPFGGSPFASVAKYLGLSGYVGSEAYQMVGGSSFLNALDYGAGSAVNNYPNTVWAIFAGNYDPWWGYVFFSGENDGVVSVASATYLGYNNLFVFPDLHTGSLDGLTWGGISYFEDQNVAYAMFEVLAS